METYCSIHMTMCSSWSVVNLYSLVLRVKAVHLDFSRTKILAVEKIYKDIDFVPTVVRIDTRYD